ncbi:hypothetical protein R5R35_010252 [Gryllus longicercus]|uniref:Uncharacterized protein n=1 Tax=Gryllus longicercus TaxID=2509291 RepID=A0AAN9UZ12_9ORTH
MAPSFFLRQRQAFTSSPFPVILLVGLRASRSLFHRLSCISIGRPCPRPYAAPARRETRKKCRGEDAMKERHGSNDTAEEEEEEEEEERKVKREWGARNTAHSFSLPLAVSPHQCDNIVVNKCATPASRKASRGVAASPCRCGATMSLLERRSFIRWCSGHNAQ